MSGVFSGRDCEQLNQRVLYASQRAKKGTGQQKAGFIHMEFEARQNVTAVLEC